MAGNGTLDVGVAPWSRPQSRVSIILGAWLLILSTVLLSGASFALAQEDMGQRGSEMTGGSGGEGVAGAVSLEEFASLQTATYEIYPTEGHNVNGTVQVTEDLDSGARVTVTLQNAEAGQLYPSHFHQGDCGSGGVIVYPLETLPGGPESIVTHIDASVFDVINSDLYINIHRSPDDLETIVACGEVGLGANDQWR